MLFLVENKADLTKATLKGATVLDCARQSDNYYGTWRLEEHLARSQPWLLDIDREAKDPPCITKDEPLRSALLARYGFGRTADHAQAAQLLARPELQSSAQAAAGWPCSIHQPW